MSGIIRSSSMRSEIVVLQTAVETLATEISKIRVSIGVVLAKVVDLTGQANLETLAPITDRLNSLGVDLRIVETAMGEVIGSGVIESGGGAPVGAVLLVANVAGEGGAGGANGYYKETGLGTHAYEHFNGIFGFYYGEVPGSLAVRDGLDADGMYWQLVGVPFDGSYEGRVLAYTDTPNVDNLLLDWNLGDWPDMVAGPGVTIL